MATTVSLRPRDRALLEATRAVSLGGPFILHDWLGRLHVAFAQSGNVKYRRSDGHAPPFAIGVDVTVSGDDAEPRMAVLPDLSVVLLFTREDPPSTFNVRETRSEGDDGFTWSTSTMAFTGGKHPDVAMGNDGTILRSAYVSGKLKATLQHPGDTAPGAEFFLKDTAGADLLVEDDCHHISQGLDNQATWILAVILNGASSVTYHASQDEGATWTAL